MSEEVEQAQSKRIFKLDLWSITAIIVSFCALGVSIYESMIMQNQQYASVWPYLEPHVQYTNHSFELSLANKGTGPAIIKSVDLMLDGESYEASVAFVKQLLRSDQFYTISINSISNSVIAIGESISIMNATVPDSLDSIPTDFPQRASIKICYCSIFGDCWIYLDGEVEKDDDCGN